jgi:glycosyltransferase involved in cell wall biosynthesis
MKRLLVITPNPITAASTRFRLVAYFDALRAAGFEPILRPFLDEDGFDILYKKGLAPAKVYAALRAFSNRTVDLVRAARVDAVLVHREAALVGPPVFEWLTTGVLDRPLIFDFDDAIWVPYTSPTYGASMSRLLKAPWKTDFTVRASDLVLAGNPYLASWARERCAHVREFPTVVDTDRFTPRKRGNSVPILGWIGTHSTVQYLRSLLPVLRRLAQRRRFVLRVVGAHLEATGIEVEVKPWQLEREIADFQGLDIGLYPLADDAWALGKSAFKAIEYMACGVPVVASPVGYTATVVVHEQTGYLARNEEEWLEYLTRLLDDAALREQLGDAGRSEAVEKWSLAVYAPRFVEAVHAVSVGRTADRTVTSKVARPS